MTPWAEPFVDVACANAEAWFRAAPRFANRVNLGTVVGYRGPSLLSEHDCVIHFARHLHDAGVPWEDMHYEISLSKWMFSPPHPAASGVDPRWRVDLALVRQDDLLAARFPTSDASVRFEAFFEFAYLGDYWTLPGADPYGAPKSGRKKVEADIEKVSRRYVMSGVSRLGYVVVFEECDWGFPVDFGAQMEAQHPGSLIRFVRAWR